MRLNFIRNHLEAIGFPAFWTGLMMRQQEMGSFH